MSHLKQFYLSFRLFIVIVFGLSSFPFFSLEAQTTYFYKGRDFGSESLYNPWNLILNGSYDIIQLNKQRDIGSIPYGIGFRTVTRNLADPFTAIRKYGVKEFFRDEIFPLTFNKNNGQWYANYTLHLIGGGMTYRAMKEWYEINHFSSPHIYSYITMAIYHFGNEVIENQSYDGITADPIADIYIFDLGGILLFSSESVCEFFSSTLNLADWSLQPSFLLRNGQLHNNGQYFSVRWKFPFWEKWYLLYFFGINGVTGLSYRFDDGKALSVGYGLTGGTLTVLDELTNKKTLNFVETLAFFYDDNNSLLTSLLWTRKTDYEMSLNLYPGFLALGDFKIGAWFVLNRKGHSLFGITTSYLPGIGL